MTPLLADTDAVKDARAALEVDPRNISKIIDFGVAQSGARQFREAIATFRRGLEIEPNNALLLRWRGHRYLSRCSGGTPGIGLAP